MIAFLDVVPANDRAAIVFDLQTSSRRRKLVPACDPEIIAGLIAPAADHPLLWCLIDTIASNAGYQSPRQVVLTLNARFGAISSEIFVAVENKMLSGRTLTLSLPLSRLLSIVELASIIAHEIHHLEHEGPRDHRTSARIWERRVRLLRDLRARKLAWRVLLYPVALCVGFITRRCAHTAAAVNHLLEFRADQAGAMACGAETTAAALMKCDMLDLVWGVFCQECAESRDTKQAPANAALDFEQMAARRLGSIGPSERAI